MKLICDTNIWYGIGNGSIVVEEYDFPQMHSTYLNIDELARTPNILYNLGSVREAIRAAMRNTKNRVIIENPWIYLLKIDNPAFDIPLGYSRDIREVTTVLAKDILIKDEWIDWVKNEWILPDKPNCKKLPIYIMNYLITLKRILKVIKKSSGLEVIPY